ncbi:MAG TPA: hypothetical protein PKA00_16470 [Saprospiraceae bacterium]|nr:hypothetical protein [Saprospiraceae bacterium]HMQ84511.1 hypothetical protein [Saprospiraceae bacterium]
MTALKFIKRSICGSCIAICGLLPAQSLEIWEIQGTGAESPHIFQQVTTLGNIVTAKGNGFFFIQCPDDRADGNPLSSDAIQVNAPYFGSIGDVVDITGTVLEVDGMTLFSTLNLETTTVASNATLPLPVLLEEDFISPTVQALHSLEKIEGMLVQLNALVNAPSDETEDIALVLHPQRSFREPGIRYPGLGGLPVWDGNPEVFTMDPNGLNAPNNRFISAGQMVSAIAVFVEEGEGQFIALPVQYSVSGDATPLPLRPKEDQEVTIGSINCLLLFQNADNYNQRLQKLSRYIAEIMQAPDIIGVQEVGSLGALLGLATKIQQMYPPLNYAAYLLDGDGDINTGFLIKTPIQVQSVMQLGENETFSGGVLHDRPPLLLQAILPTDPPTPIHVLNVHIRSLLGIEGDNADFVRSKRHQQALSIAHMADEWQEAGNFFIIGDYNAYQFTDGYVDVANQIAGLPSLGAQYPTQAIVEPPLMNLVLGLPQEEQYSYVFNNNPQVLDQCMAGSILEAIQINEMAYARANADHPLAYFDNPALVQRCSDHDGFVVYLGLDRPLAHSNALNEAASFEVKFPNPLPQGYPIFIRSRENLKHIVLSDTAGRTLWVQPLLGKETSLSLPDSFPSGAFLWMEIEDVSGKQWIGRLLMADF